MQHGTSTKPAVARRFGDFTDMRRFFDSLPNWLAPFEPMRLEEEMLDDTFVVRAEMPGIDPEKDADIWIADGMLHITAERRHEEREETEGSFRSEFSYGSFHRAVEVPRGTTAEDVRATYKDGVLEVRLPIRTSETQVAKVPITKT